MRKRPGGVNPSVNNKESMSRVKNQLDGKSGFIKNIRNLIGFEENLTRLHETRFVHYSENSTARLLYLLCGTTAVFLLIVFGMTFWMYTELHSAQLFICTMLLVTTGIPFFNTLTNATQFWSWFLCLFLIVMTSLAAGTNAGISSVGSVFLLVPIFLSLLLLTHKGSLLITFIVCLSFLGLTFFGIAGQNNGFSTREHGYEYARCGTLIVSALTFALIGWLISYNTSLSRQKLIEARDAAQKANREKSEFIASIAHEIRTPLTGLMGMLELLTKEKLEPHQKEMAETSRSSSRDILNLINDLLDMSKMEIGELRLVPEPVDIAGLFRQTTREFQPSAADKGLEFHVSAPTHPVWVLIDPLRFRQIVSNYLSNALKFTDEGVIEVGLFCEERDGGHVNLHIEVKDTGPGIPETLLPTIFNRFVQVEQTQKAKYGGTGIGLAVVSDLAKLQGAKVWAESEIGKGSQFYFQGDFKRTSAMDIPEVGNLDDETRAALTVLIADDSVGSQRVLTRVLRGLGYHTVSVKNGSEAVLAVTEHNIDLVLMDLNMPVKDGLTALREIRALPAPICDLPVIGLSADNSQSDMDNWRDANVDGFVAKPVDFAILDLTIRRIVGTRRTDMTEPANRANEGQNTMPSKSASA